VCINSGPELQSGVKDVIEAFLLSTESPLLFLYSTLSLAATF
jgi:hypothetical protein